MTMGLPIAANLSHMHDKHSGTNSSYRVHAKLFPGTFSNQEYRYLMPEWE